MLVRRCGQTSKLGRAGGTFAVDCPATLIAPLDAALTPQRGIPAIKGGAAKIYCRLTGIV